MSSQSPLALAVEWTEGGRKAGGAGGAEGAHPPTRDKAGAEEASTLAGDPTGRMAVAWRKGSTRDIKNSTMATRVRCGNAFSLESREEADTRPNIHPPCAGPAPSATAVAPHAVVHKVLEGVPEQQQLSNEEFRRMLFAPKQ